MYYQLHGPYLNTLEIVPIGGVFFDDLDKRVEVSNGTEWIILDYFDNDESHGPEWVYKELTKDVRLGKLNQNFMLFKESNGKKKLIQEQWYDLVIDPANHSVVNQGYVLFADNTTMVPKQPKVVIPQETYKESLSNYGKY